MKLRSESRTVAASETPIAFMLPATQAITIGNASSPLLRLPQELKDRIYHFVYGYYFCIHAQGRCSDDDLRIRLYACQNPFCHNFSAYDLEAVKDIHFASLGICRQMYHDAKTVFYSANRFKFSNPKSLNQFIRRIDDASHRNLAVRSVHLYVRVCNKNEEREWDNTFRTLAEGLKNLRELEIDVSERIWSHLYDQTRRQSPAHGKKPFLRGLLELRKLPLKAFELVVTDLVGCERRKEYTWTTIQKREWAQSMKSAILGSNGR